ncbi:MAG: sigma-70 family RNA polymerase sigma factor [Prolixibacteraceae bacterium]
MNKSNVNISMEKKKYSLAFEEFFRFYHSRLRRYARYFLKDPEEADDLVQEVFLQLWKDQTLLDPDRNLPSFTFTLVRNRCFDRLRKRIVEEKYLLHQAKKESEELYHISFDKTGEFISMEELLHRELLKLIEKMPPKCGIAFRLRWIDGKKVREIALEMNISSTMVDKYLAKGLSFAKDHLNPDLFVLLLMKR